MEFSFNNVGVEKVSSVPMKGRSLSRCAISAVVSGVLSAVLSGVLFPSAAETAAYVDKPAPAPSAVAAARKLRRTIVFMSVSFQVFVWSGIRTASVCEMLQFDPSSFPGEAIEGGQRSERGAAVMLLTPT